MKRLGLILCLCLWMGLPLNAEDPVVLRIEDRVVRLSEFLWYFDASKNLNQEDVHAYLQRFVHYQLKVADARRSQLDTLSSFRTQREVLQARVLKEHFTDHQLADLYARQWTEKLSQRRETKEWVKVDLYTYRIPQHPSASDEKHAVRIMDEWYRRLQQIGSPQNADIAWASANGIEQELSAAQWVPMGNLLKEMKTQLGTLEKGTYASPFYCPMGLSIIRWVDKKSQADPADFHRQIVASLDRLGKTSPILKHSILEQWTEGKYKLPQEVVYQLQQAYDGLLSVYWDQQHPVDQVAASAEQLSRFFRSHKENYRWTYPHFKGAVIHCVNKKAASKIKKRLKKVPMIHWPEALDRLQQENPELRNESACGLFQIGKNSYVDRLAFKCGTFQVKADLPYTFLLGKKLKKGPESYEDVLQQVKTDYQKQHENDQISQLLGQFTIEINEDVLKTVNSCGNK